MDETIQKELEAEAAELVEGKPVMEPTDRVLTDGEPDEKPAEGEGTTPEVEGKPDASVADSGKPAQMPPEGKIDDALLKALEETPFKSVPDVVKGYKNILSESTKFREKAKPFEQLIDEASVDRNLGNYIQQAVMLYKNPQLAAAYATPGGSVASPPDPRNYDMFNPEQVQKYQTDLQGYMARELDGRLNARLSDMEQRQTLEKMKFEFKQAYPSADPESVLKWYREKGPWSLTDVYKAMNYDNLKSEALNEARREITKQMESARTTKTPAGASTSSEPVKIQDVLDYVTRYGEKATRKKFGDTKYLEALRVDAENFMK